MGQSNGISRQKTGEVHICVDLRKLNDACLHDPFPTPFTDKVLEGVGGQEVHLFMDGFSCYHDIYIVKEDRQKTKFVMELGFFQYLVMSFGLKNAPAIFSRFVITTFKNFIQKFLESYMDDWTIYGLVKYHIANL